MSELMISGERVIAALKDAGVRWIVALPDATTSAAVLWPISRDPYFKLIRVCKEDEAVSMCAAFSACGERAVALIQYTGFLDSINTIRAVAVEYGQSVCMMIGLLEKEPGVPPRESKVYSVRIVEPILDALELRHLCIEADADLTQLTSEIGVAYATSCPFAALIGHYVQP